jgi:hypothetical protein
MSFMGFRLFGGPITTHLDRGSKLYKVYEDYKTRYKIKEYCAREDMNVILLRAYKSRHRNTLLLQVTDKGVETIVETGLQYAYNRIRDILRTKNEKYLNLYFECLKLSYVFDFAYTVNNFMFEDVLYGRLGYMDLELLYDKCKDLAGKIITYKLGGVSDVSLANWIKIFSCNEVNWGFFKKWLFKNTNIKLLELTMPGDQVVSGKIIVEVGKLILECEKILFLTFVRLKSWYGTYEVPNLDSISLLYNFWLNSFFSPRSMLAGAVIARIMHRLFTIEITDEDVQIWKGLIDKMNKENIKLSANILSVFRNFGIEHG